MKETRTLHSAVALTRNRYFWYLTVLAIFTAAFAYADVIFIALGLASPAGLSLTYYIALHRCLFLVTVAVTAWRFGIKAGLAVCCTLGLVIVSPWLFDPAKPDIWLQIGVVLLGIILNWLIGRQGDMKRTLEDTMHQLQQQAVKLNLEINERKRVEEVLRESERRYRLLAENATDVIWTVSIDNPEELTYISPSVTLLLGYSIEEAMSKKMVEIFATDSYNLAMETFREALALENGGVGDLPRSRTLEIYLYHQDGSVVPVEIKCSFVHNPEGKPVEILVIARDISERKQIEEQLIMTDRLATIGEMVSGIAHELNNPLTSIIGFSQLVKEETDLKNNREELELIYREAQRAAGIVKNLLSFSRKRTPVKQLSQINDIINDVLKLRAYEEKLNNINIVFQAAPNLPETMLDYFQIQQVFLNIVVNAESAMLTAHQGGTLNITTELVKEYIRVTFSDDGPGISKENLNRIFEPFFTTKEVGQGTGLGLSICHGIVYEHGGRIYARNNLHQGVSFYVELPVRSNEQQDKSLKD